MDRTLTVFPYKELGMTFRLISIFFLVLSVNVSAIDISSEKFDKLDIRFTEYEEGQMTLPVVLIYDSSGKLTHSFVGKDINKLESYKGLSEKPLQTRVSSSNIHSITKHLGYQAHGKPRILVFLGIEICPPCYTMLGTFHATIKPSIEGEFEIIPINILVGK